MAKRFLTHVDLAGNQLLNASLEKLSADPTTGLFEGRMYYNTTSDLIRVYDGTQWLPVGAITDVQGTADEVEVTVTDGVATVGLPATINANTTGNAATATKLATARTISLSGDLSGSATFDGSANATITATIAANSVALGTDTTGDYVASVSGSDGISITGTGEGAAVTIANTDKGSDQNIFKTVSIDGTTSIVADSNNSTLNVTAGTGISLTANAGMKQFSINNTGVLSVAGTADQITASTSSGAVTLSLPSAVTFPGTVTLHADPTQALHAATKQYVDNAVAGLDWHPSANLLAATNVALTGTSGTLVIDGHAALDDADDGYRILLKGQTTGSENGIYVYSDNGSTYTLTRAEDANTYQELVGAAVFIMEGTVYGTTAWIQTNHYLTSFSDQSWTQFSGSGTYVAGNGLTLTGTSFSIDTAITVDKDSVQTLTNKTLTSPTITNPSVSGLYISDNTIVIEGTADSFETTVNFTDPTADRTITFKDESGTVAYTADITSAINALTLIRKYSTNVGNGSNTSFTVNHALNTRDVQVQVYDNATYDTVEVDVIRTDNNNVTVAFSTAPSSNAYRVVVIG